MIWLALCATGALGAVLRLILERRFMPRPTTSQNPWRGWPVGILLANLCGTLFLGLLLGYVQGHGGVLSPEGFAALHGSNIASAAPWVVATGLCGSLSTVSTLCVGAVALTAQQRSRGWCYLGTTLVLGVATASLAYLLGLTLA